jgi:hypothetical protein
MKQQQHIDKIDLAQEIIGVILLICLILRILL